jgi:hypothetical protein
MQLTAHDLETFEAYKKAMRAASGQIAPMLKDLPGSKSGALNHELFKLRATVFKDLPGKEILIPPPGGGAADPMAAAATADTLKTLFGPFSFFSNVGPKSSVFQVRFRSVGTSDIRGGVEA